MGLVNGVCKPVYPHDFMKVNTMFEVIKAAGMRTAWSDKHPAYDIVNGPSGAGVDDLYAVEVDSNDAITGQDTTLGYHSIERNDERKVDAILNEINGMDSTGKQTVGIPAVFGMNFQSVSIGEKLAVGNSNDPADAGLVGGYADALGARLPYDSLTQLRATLAAAYPHLVRFDVVASADPAAFAAIAELGGSVDRAPFAPAIKDFYLTNPIARASRVMAECAALAQARTRQAAE